MKNTINVWIARDKDGETMYLFNEPPQRDEIGEYWAGKILKITDENLPEELAKKVTWNGEPVELEITIKAKKK